MPRLTGRKTNIGIAREPTRGTSVPPVYWIPVLDMDFDDKLDMIDNESGFGNLAAISDNVPVRQWGEGDYSGKIFDKSVGLEMVGLFGQLPTSVQRSTTGVYDNTYAMLQLNQQATLTAAVTDTNYSGRFALCSLNTWSLEAELGAYIRRSVNLIGKASVVSTESVAYTNEAEFIPKHMIVKMAAAGASDATLDAATSIKVRSVNFEINKNVEATQVFSGNNDIEDTIVKQIEITGEFEMYYDDRTYQNLAKAGTHQSLRIEMINTDLTIGTSGTNNPALRFQFPEVALGFPERGYGNNDVITQTISFKAMLNIATGTLATARVTNAVNGASSY